VEGSLWASETFALVRTDRASEHPFWQGGWDTIFRQQVPRRVRINARSSIPSEGVTMKTLFIDLGGQFHDYGAEVFEESAGSVYPFYENTRYAPLGSVNGLMIYRGITTEQFEMLTESRYFVSASQ
jgi:hypothetical protein